MYRLVIEHPEWIPAQWQQKLDLRAGNDRGRIYRISVASDTEVAPRDLTALPPKALVDLLESPGGEQRDRAHQMLLWHAKPPIQSLTAMLRNGKTPQARLHAMCVLDGLKQLPAAAVIRALRDRHASVVRHAIRLVGAKIAAGEIEPGVLADLQPPRDVRARMQLAYSLGELPGDTGAAALARIGLMDAADKYMVAALMTSLNASNANAVWRHAQQGATTAAQQQLVLSLFDQSLAGSRPGAIEKLVLQQARAVAAQPTPDAMQLEVIARSLERLRATGGVSKSVQTALQPLASKARLIAAGEGQPAAARQTAVNIIAHSGQAPELLELMAPRLPQKLQQMALDGIARSGDAGALRKLLQSWPTRSPAIRAQIVAAALKRESFTRELLGAMNSGIVPAGSLPAASRSNLTGHRNKAIARQAASLLQQTAPATRAAVLRKYEPALKLPASAVRGQAVFTKRCTSCHRAGQQGRNTGPDLAALKDRSKPAMLTAIFNPNAAVEDRFLAYTVATTGGAIYTGILEEETGASIKLRQADGKEKVLVRAQIEEISTSGKSLMPEGLEKDITLQEAADLMP